MIKLTALRTFRHKGRWLMAGETLQDTPRNAKLLRAVRYAELAPPDEPAPPAPSAAAAAAPRRARAPAKPAAPAETKPEDPPPQIDLEAAGRYMRRDLLAGQGD